MLTAEEVHDITGVPVSTPHDWAAKRERGMPGAPAIASPRGARLSLENWKRAVNWQAAIAKVGRERLRVHDLRHTYASLSRRAGADLRLLQKAMGHASITVTAHTYADLFDDELDNIATALDSLTDDLSQGT
jgi:integrase